MDTIKYGVIKLMSKQESRTKIVIKNASVSLAQNYLTLIISFVTRTVFIKTLGAEYLGVNGLFSDIFNMLSLMELGVGSAITYYLYKPLYEKDSEKVKLLMDLYKKLYNTISILIFIVGILLIPFLGYIIEKTDIPNIELIYILMLINVASSYLFSYRRTLLEADQKSYINSINQLIFNITKNIIQIIILVTLRNFYAYLLINIFTTVFSNIAISLKTKKLYPYLNEKSKEKLDKDERKIIFSRMGAVMCHKIGSIVVYGTDNLLLSIVSNLKIVGLYSNYSMIINIVNTPINQIFNALIASIGNVGVSEDNHTSRLIFERINFIGYCLISFCSIALFSLLNPFINIWLGNKYLLDETLVFVLVCNFFISAMKSIPGNFNYAKGLFWNTRFKPILEALANLIVSLILMNYLGIIGVFLGTTIGYLLTSFWIDPYVLYKNWFKVSFSNYLLTMFKYILITLIKGFITYKLVTFISLSNNLITFIIQMTIVVVVPNLIMIFLFRKSENYIYAKNLLLNQLKTKFKK